ncbi:MAG: twin-arginine translocase TatA/TatE family subunit [Nitrososphaeraceae archaeon]
MFQNFLLLLPHGAEWIFIILAVIVLIFGYKKIPELARSIGKASSEFEKARIQSKKELDQLKGFNDIEKDKYEFKRKE